MNQKNALTLFNIYEVLLKTYEEVSTKFMLGQITTEELELKETYDTFDRLFEESGKVSNKALLTRARGHLSVHVR